MILFFFNLEVKKGHLLSFNIGFNIIHSNFFGGWIQWKDCLSHFFGSHREQELNMSYSHGVICWGFEQALDSLYTLARGKKSLWFSTESQKCFWFPDKGCKNHHLELYEFLDMPQQARGLGVMRNHQVSVTFLLTFQPTITPWWSLGQRLLCTTYLR